eukprot:4165596-Amphidinium_carterae.1
MSLASQSLAFFGQSSHVRPGTGIGRHAFNMETDLVFKALPKASGWRAIATWVSIWFEVALNDEKHRALCPSDHLRCMDQWSTPRRTAARSARGSSYIASTCRVPIDFHEIHLSATYGPNKKTLQV